MPPHAWFPVTMAARKADEDNIPLFGWRDDGWLDMINQATNDPDTVVLWFRRMKQLGCYDTSARKTVLKVRYPFIKRLADRLWQKKNR